MLSSDPGFCYAVAQASSLRPIPGEGRIDDNTAAIVEWYGMCNNGPTLQLWGQPEQEKDQDNDQDEDQAVDKELILAQY
jgi:hypothetical protein